MPDVGRSVSLLERSEFRELRSRERMRQLVAGEVEPAVTFTETEFMWECPGCGHAWYGMLGPEPVGGWDDPRWRKTGSDDAPTLEPSLGCPGWRDGTCAGGHYWLRDGRLVSA